MQQFGNTVRLPLNAAGNRFVNTPVQLLHAESDEGMFTVTLAPGFAGPNVPTTGNPLVIMQWGNARGRQQTAFPYPPRGVVFTVAGTFLDLAVQAFDLATAVTAADVPTLVAWATPGAAASRAMPVSTTIGGLSPLDPYTKSVVLCAIDAAWTITLVEWLASDGATVVATQRVNTRVAEIPVPNIGSPVKGACFIKLTADAGNVLMTENVVYG